MKIFSSCFKLACVYTDTVVGAGFASGQEIWRFFGRFGQNGFWGIMLFCVILGLVGGGMMLKIYRLNITTYDDFCTSVFGNKVGKWVSKLGCAFMFATFCVMISGSGALFSQELGSNTFTGIVFMGAICFCIFLFDIKGMTVMNTILTPPMIIGIFMLGSYIILYGDRGAVSSLCELISFNNNWLIATLIYVSYNLITVPAVISLMRKEIISPNVALIGGISGGVVLGLGGLCIYITSLSPDFYLTQIPALNAAGLINKYFKIYYGIVVYAALLTTAISCGMGFIKYISHSKSFETNFIISLITCVTGCLIAMLGFSTLIEYFYTIFGYIGLFMSFVLFKDAIFEINIWRKS